MRNFTSGLTKRLKAEELRSDCAKYNVSIEEVARKAGLTPQDLQMWARGTGIPRRPADQLRTALWEVRQEQAFREHGAPPCPWIASLNNAKPGELRGALREIETHFANCQLCQRRESVAAVVAAEVGRAPPTGDFWGRIVPP